MYISNIEIKGYRNFCEETSIEFHKGLNILVGENGTGKSSIIDAIRLLLAEDEYGRSGIRETDFHKAFTENAIASDYLQIQALFDGLNEEDKVVFLPWMTTEDNAQLTLRVENKPNSYGRYKRYLWGGVSRDSMFEPELFETVTSIYLPPLRDAEAKLRSGRNSRLARLLINLNKTELNNARENEQLHPLEALVKDFNNSLATDEDSPISKVDELIQERLAQALGQVFGQDTSVQFSEVNFRRIVEGLRILFFPLFRGVENKGLYRDLEENSLGYNNLIYLATILAELTNDSIENEYLKVLLIEEPEAHLHPQIQVRLLKYLEEQAQDNSLQIILTTHSPVIASSASLESIIFLNVKQGITTADQVENCGLSDLTQKFLQRWMDVTKSTLFFSKGILFVEGLAEAMLMSELANRVLKQYNDQLHEEQRKLPESLEESGLTIINMGGIYFKHFFQLFANLTDNNEVRVIPIKCAGITDNDPEEEKPTPDNPAVGKNHAIKLVDKVNSSNNCRLFVSPLKTFEYDLAMQGENLKVMLPLLPSTPQDRDLREKVSKFGSENWSDETMEDFSARADVSFYLLNSIDKGPFAQSLSEKLTEHPEMQFDIPDYIKKAILWVVGEIDG